MQERQATSVPVQMDTHPRCPKCNRAHYSECIASQCCASVPVQFKPGQRVFSASGGKPFIVIAQDGDDVWGRWWPVGKRDIVPLHWLTATDPNAEPLTEEWLTRVGIWGGRFDLLQIETGNLVRCLKFYGKTIGDVRTLCRLLGVALKEP